MKTKTAKQLAPKMKMTTDIPPAITTSDTVETRLGTLHFQEVLARDQEVQAALNTAINASARINELGVQWLSDVVRANIRGRSPQSYSIVVNQDFIPSGWVYDQEIPVVK
jgi:hypothetical protein